MLSQASQDYLKVIYQLTADFGRASTQQIAEKLEVTPASVTGMLQKMAQAEPPLVEYEKHQGVTLTAEGKKAALEMIRHHRLIELFLQEKLGYEWDEVHEEADRLEHAISEQMEARMAELLNHPCRNPHGQPIPTADLQLHPSSEFPLSKLHPGQQAVVRRVEDESAELLRYLGKLGLRPFARLTALESYPFDQNLRVQVVGQADSVVLGQRVTGQVYVDIIGN